MTTERIELLPGVVLTAVRTEKFKSSYWSLRLLAPLEQETAALNAVLPFVLRRGTARLPDLSSLSAALDELYGGAVEPAVRKCGDMQCIGFEATFLDDLCVPNGTPIMEQAAALLGDLLLHPATKNGRLRQDYVLGERDNLIRMIQSNRNDKRRYAQERLIEEMFAGQVYATGRLGSVEQAKKISVAKLFAQYQTLLERAPIELFYCGSVPAQRVELAWREALMGLPRQQDRYPVETDPRHGKIEQVRIFTEHMDVTQCKMELGFRIGFGLADPMYPALLVANAMFGGTTTSRLFLHVREKLGLCYYASSALVSVKGLVLVSCGVDQADVERAKDEILDQLGQLQRGEFTSEEFEAARMSVTNMLRMALDDQGHLCSYWLMDRAAGEDLDLEQLILRVEDVTEGMAAAAAMELTLDSIYCLSGPEEEGEGQDADA